MKTEEQATYKVNDNMSQQIKNMLAIEICNLARKFMDSVDECGCDGDTHGWIHCSEEYEDMWCCSAPLEDWELSFKFVANWQYCAWTELWSDPYCSPSFSQTKNFECELVKLDIFDPDGGDVEEGAIKEIVGLVNDKLHN